MKKKTERPEVSPEERRQRVAASYAILLTALKRLDEREAREAKEKETEAEGGL